MIVLQLHIVGALFLRQLTMPIHKLTVLSISSQTRLDCGKPVITISSASYEMHPGRKVPKWRDVYEDPINTQWKMINLKGKSAQHSPWQISWKMLYKPTTIELTSQMFSLPVIVKLSGVSVILNIEGFELVCSLVTIHGRVYCTAVHTAWLSCVKYWRHKTK